MNPKLSVIICTHNPRMDYLERVLNSLKFQTLSKDSWELLLVDNASHIPLDSQLELSWHPQYNYVREDELGLTPARLRGISESKSEILVFVDDDNVLDSEFLELTAKIAIDFPFIGAWGGQILPEFEFSPPEWAEPFLGYLALREVKKEQWSNLIHQLDTTPHGAGLCVRKSVAKQYAMNVKNDVRRLKLGRRGVVSDKQIPLSCEDTDLSYTACDMGFGTGLFPELKLTHIIPKERLTKEYLSRLVQGTTYSKIILESLRGKFPEPLDKSLKSKLSEFYHLRRMHPIQRQIQKSIRNADLMARQKIVNLEENILDI